MGDRKYRQQGYRPQTAEPRRPQPPPADVPRSGGTGDPLERDPPRVRDDVLDDYVSIEAARSRYGVALRGAAEGEPSETKESGIDPAAPGASADLVVDHDATRALRARMKAER